MFQPLICPFSRVCENRNCDCFIVGQEERKAPQHV